MENKPAKDFEGDFFKIVPDTESKTLTVITSGGASVTLNDSSQIIGLEDSSGNKIQLDNAGIKIESAGFLRIESARDFNATAMNINLKAHNGLVSKGGSRAELNSNGQTHVKGTLVLIG